MSTENGYKNNYCVNQPAVVEKVFNTVKEYELGFNPSDEPLIEVRIREGLYLNVSWLSYPYLDYEGKAYKLIDFLEEAEEPYKVELVKDILENWYRQFCHLCDDKAKGGWSDNYNALSVIWYAIQNGEEFNVYVPMFDINFTNEDGENDGEELWKPVDAFGEFLDQAMDCYEYIMDHDKSADDIVTKLNDEHSLYSCIKSYSDGVITSETSADIDREFTEDERKRAVKKLEKVRAELKRQAKEAGTNRNADKLEARMSDKHVLTATRKLKDCLKALKKYHLPKHTLDVDGWVVRLDLVSSRVDNGKANYRYTIKLPWVDHALSFSDFDAYVTAKKDKKCPVAWEYLYIIDKFLQNL